MGEAGATPERQFAEEVAVTFERFGLARGAGRLLGWLLICDPARQSTADLVAGLGVSKASVSTATRLLTSLGLVHRVVVPGDRSDYFEIKPDTFETAHDQLGTLRLFHDLMDRGLQLIKDQGGARRARLHESREFYAFLDREYPLMIKRFQEQFREEGERDG